ncbi:MFS transporter [Paenibacillus montaniterrae]|uniref:MFS transporter n=1 Tax=Paenibacillus montaniterrae TaxID=429341 RepID=A0A919YKW2_9BACL|nr:MFS transporter [Paenibacillus montaniterrae]GIP16292.1 MFS transporter [Paenibacillus montaniterrae]
MNSSWKRTAFFFLTGQGISMFGSMIVQYAIMWHITLSLQSGLAMTIFIICGFLPSFLISPFAGVWADRFDRKKLIIAADALIAIATLILAIVFLSGYEEIWLLFVMAAIRALGSGVHMPAIGALLPQFVPEEHLMRINGLNGTIQAVVMFISPIVSAGLLTATSLSNIFFVDVITAVLGITTLLLFVPVAAHERSKQKEKVSYFEDMKQGIVYVRQHPFLKVLLLFFVLFFILLAPASFLTPLQTARSFGEDEWRLAALEIVFSVGMMLGGAAVSTWGGFRNRIKTITAAIAWMAACTLALGVVPGFTIYLVFMGLFGVAMPFLNSPMNVIFQEKVDPNYLGRVFGIVAMISTSMMPMGMLIFGPLADFVEIELLLIITGAVLLVITLLFGRNKTLLKAGEPSPAPIPASVPAASEEGS